MNNTSNPFSSFDAQSKDTKFKTNLNEPIDFNTIENEINCELLKHKEIRCKYKIDVTELIPPPPIAWSLTNTKKEGIAILGTLGNFSLIIGKAKSRKSFFVNIAVSSALGKDLILNRFKSNLPIDKNEVVYFDTEQGKYHVQRAVKRICTQINVNEPKNLHTYYLRSLTPRERLRFIENEIYSNNKIGFVVIDGIKDLVTSINDEEQATTVVCKLLKWTEERNIHIVTVLHQNKSDTNARGHIGTECINKAETVLSVTKAETNNDISIVEPQQCRDIEPEVFAFEINEFGLPVIAEDFEIRTETKHNKFDVTDMEEHKKYKLLLEVYSNGKEFIYSELVTQLKLAYKKQFGKDIGTNRLKDIITDCKNRKWLIQEKSKAPYTLAEFQSV
jgi:predicted ATP-dependent serine protease